MASDDNAISNVAVTVVTMALDLLLFSKFNLLFIAHMLTLKLPLGDGNGGIRLHDLKVLLGLIVLFNLRSVEEKLLDRGISVSYTHLTLPTSAIV